MAHLYTALCKELDLLLIEIIQDMQSYVTQKVELEKVMNDGFLNIAKTRYINGSSSVTTLQLPTELSNPIKPLATVERNNDTQYTSFKIVNKLSLDKEVASSKDGLRKRLVAEKEDLSKTEPMTNPIRLFGVLVPQSLRIAQKSFIISVDQIANVAQIQCSLEEKSARYNKLLRIKKQLL